MHGKQVPIQNPRLAHAVTAATKQIVGTRMKEARIDAAVVLDVLDGEDGFAGRDATDHRQRELRRLRALRDQPDTAR
jgi:hypothetical protein